MTDINTVSVEPFVREVRQCALRVVCKWRGANVTACNDGDNDYDGNDDGDTECLILCIFFFRESEVRNFVQKMIIHSENIRCLILLFHGNSEVFS
jgi:hypothetical protein